MIARVEAVVTLGVLFDIGLEVDQRLRMVVGLLRGAGHCEQESGAKDLSFRE